MSDFLRRLSSRVKKDRKNDNEAIIPSSSSSLAPPAVGSTTVHRPDTYSDSPNLPPTLAEHFSHPSLSTDTTPAYNVTGSNQTAVINATENQADDPLSFLSTFDTKFLIDDSSSMKTSSIEGSSTRWAVVSEVLAQIVPICTKYDKDGIDIHFLNRRNQSEYLNITDPKAVDGIFRNFSPCGVTDTGGRLKAILDRYLLRCEEAKMAKKDWPKPVNIIVITDGKATDDLRGALSNIGKRLNNMEADAWQVGVQFCQVGNDPKASEDLAILEDGLAAECGCRDFVDTQRFDPAQGDITEDLILKAVLGAVNKRWDRKTIGQST